MAAPALHLLPLLDRLAGVQLDDGALSEAAESRHRAMKIAIAAYGGSSINAARAMTALAEIDILRLRYLDAEPAADRRGRRSERAVPAPTIRHCRNC